MKTAKCACGQLSATVEGEPVRLSMCHCLDCQRRTGSVFGVQARYPREDVTISGASSEYARVADSGNTIRFAFCPECGSTVHWAIDEDPSLIAVAVGAFADPGFGAPKFSVYEERMHAWVNLTEMEIDHMD